MEQRMQNSITISSIVEHPFPAFYYDTCTKLRSSRIKRLLEKVVLTLKRATFLR